MKQQIKSNKIKILITGSTGNLGKELRDYLKKENYDILCLTRNKKLSYDIEGDMTDYHSLFNATKDIDVVIHLAALLKGNRKSINKVNVLGTENLIKACEENKVKSILFISSLDVKFKTHYGISKLKAEQIIQKSKLRYLILRPSAIYGENFKTGINLLVKILKKTRIIPIPGSGKNLYQPIYSGDLIRLIRQIIDKNNFNNQAYFVGGKDAISFNQLIDLISINLARKIIKIHLPFKSKDFKFDKICSNEKIKKDFSFNPISIREGIEKII